MILEFNIPLDLMNITIGINMIIQFNNRFD